MSTQRTTHKAPFDHRHFSSWRGPNGRRACRGCGEEVPRGRSSWCSKSCFDDRAPRLSQAWARHLVFDRDQGVCAACGLDTQELRLRVLEYAQPVMEMRPPAACEDAAAYSERVKRKVRLRRAHLVAAGEYEAEGRALLNALGFRAGHGQLWEMDHIKPVVEGGGECSLRNLRTLCVPCHKRATADLARRLAEHRREGKPSADAAEGNA